MEVFKMNVQLRWSDLDPNYHVRHSAYYDWGALCRIQFLNDFGLSTDVMAKLQFGPILFREECIFRKEIKLGDEVTINLGLLKSRKDFSRWSIQHEIFKGDQLAAKLTVDGAWINMVLRKLATPPPEVAEVFNQMPKGEGFEWQ
jgi:acyl-CoA thioester hydrolase